MKFSLTFKTPDVLDQLSEQFEENVDEEDARDFAKNYLEYEEYITVSFDTVFNSAKVAKPSEGD